jgi:hypothetical protein
MGPIGVAYEYSALERAFGLRELHALLPDGRAVVVVRDPHNRRSFTASNSSPAAARSARLVGGPLPF